MDDRRTDASAGADYAARVDRAVARLCGVGYQDLLGMHAGLDRDGVALAKSEEISMAPEVFAEKFRQFHGMAAGDADLNRYRAALLAFSSGSRWKVSGDGPACMSTEMGTLELHVVRKDGKLGFGVLMEGQSQDEAYVRLDIGDAIQGKMLQLRAGPAEPSPVSPGMGR